MKIVQDIRMVVSNGGEWQIQVKKSHLCKDASGAICDMTADCEWEEIPTIQGDNLLISTDERLCRERDIAEHAADRLASIILGQPCDWPCHETAWKLAAEAAKEKPWAAMLFRANDVLRSMYQIVDREGKDTNWQAIRNQLIAVLAEQHQAMYPMPK
jgi:hypothetical protein